MQAAAKAAAKRLKWAVPGPVGARFAGPASLIGRWLAEPASPLGLGAMGAELVAVGGILQNLAGRRCFERGGAA